MYGMIEDLENYGAFAFALRDDPYEFSIKRLNPYTTKRYLNV